MEKLIKLTAIIAFLTAKLTAGQSYVGETLFPFEKQDGLKAEWCMGANDTPVEMTAYSYDTHVKPESWTDVSDFEENMPYFKMARVITEEMTAQFLRILARGDKKKTDSVKLVIIKDLVMCVESALVTAEKMRFQILGNGKILVSGNGVNRQIDYKLAANQKVVLTGTSMWSDNDNSTPIKDINNAAKTIEEDTGERPTRAICNLATFQHIADNTAIKEALFKKDPFYDDNTVIAYILKKTKIKLKIYSKMYKTAENVSIRYMKDNVFTLLPSTTVGTFKLGPTPEETRKEYQDIIGTKVDVGYVKEGIAVTHYSPDSELGQIGLKASFVGVPSGENLNKISILNVAV